MYYSVSTYLIYLNETTSAYTYFLTQTSPNHHNSSKMGQSETVLIFGFSPIDWILSAIMASSPRIEENDEGDIILRLGQRVGFFPGA